MGFVLEPGSALNALSGLVILFLGLALLSLDLGSRRNLAVGLFAAVWGVQIALANTPQLTDDLGLARMASAGAMPFLLLVAPLLAGAVRSVVPGRHPALRTVQLATLALSAAGAALLILVPSALLGSLVAPSGDAHLVLWGPLVPWLISLPITLVLAVVLRALARARLQAPTRHERARLSVVLGAVALYASYRFVDSLFQFSLWMLEVGPEPRAIGELLVGVIGIAFLVDLAVRLLAERRRALDPDVVRETGLLLAAAGVPAAAAGLAFAPLLWGGPALVTLGGWRLAAVALLVWGVARDQRLDLDLQARRALPAGAALMTPFLVVPLFQFVGDAGEAGLGLTGLVAGATSLTAALAVQATVPRRATSHGEDRRLVLYAAALRAGEPASSLARLRERLGVSDDEHGRLVALAAGADPGPDPREAEPGVVLFDTYRVEAVLAKTARGPVLLARDELLDRAVVLKPLGALPEDRDERERVLDEGRIAARVRHPCIVQVHAIERLQEQLWLVIEHVPGGDLRARVDRDGPFPPATAAAIGRHLLDALDAVHAHGITHRDVTPGNVFLGASGEPMLGDFGLARARGGTGALQGTLMTASPEQVAGEHVDERSDLYQVGALVYWMLTGRCYVPIEGRPLPHAIQLVRTAPPMLPLPGVPGTINEVLARALEKDPAQRFPSARAMRETLDAPAAGTGLLVRPAK